MADDATAGAAEGRMSLTATPFIEFMVHPHPKLVDSHTQEPLVPIMHSPLSPDKLADGSLPNAQVIKQRARTARQVTARRSLEMGDGIKSVAQVRKDAETYWAAQAAGGIRGMDANRVTAGVSEQPASTMNS